MKEFDGWKDDKRFGRLVYRKPLVKILAAKNIVRESNSVKILEFKHNANEIAKKLLAAARKNEPLITKQVSIYFKVLSKCGNTHEVSVNSRPYSVRASALNLKTYSQLLICK